MPAHVHRKSIKPYNLQELTNDNINLNYKFHEKEACNELFQFHHLKAKTIVHKHLKYFKKEEN